MATTPVGGASNDYGVSDQMEQIRAQNAAEQIRQAQIQAETTRLNMALETMKQAANVKG